MIGGHGNMRYYINEVNGVIQSIGTGDAGGIEITEQEYNNILNVINNAKEGFVLKRIDGAYVYVQDINYTPKDDGTYIHPFVFDEGVELIVGCFYLFPDGNIWEWIREGEGASTCFRFDII